MSKCQFKNVRHFSHIIVFFVSWLRKCQKLTKLKFKYLRNFMWWQRKCQKIIPRNFKNVRKNRTLWLLSAAHIFEILNSRQSFEITHFGKLTSWEFSDIFALWWIFWHFSTLISVLTFLHSGQFSDIFASSEIQKMSENWQEY